MDGSAHLLGSSADALAVYKRRAIGRGCKGCDTPLLDGMGSGQG